MSLQATLPTTPRRRSARREMAIRAWVRERWATTPGRLTLVMMAVIAGALTVAVVATVAERSRAHAAETVRDTTEPLLAQAATLNSTLSDANATATTTFLRGGLEPPARRARYLTDLRVASDALATLTRELAGSTDTRPAVATITEQLPVYSGLVEAARADNRQGLPVGSAYLRQAAKLLTATILPATVRLYATESKHLSDGYGSGAAVSGLIAVLAIMTLGIVGLLATQVWVARISRRTINIPLALASVLLLGGLVWAAVSLTAEGAALDRARTGSDAVEVLSTTRVLLSRAQSDQSLALVNRGSDETDPIDFAAVVKTLAAAGGLLAEDDSVSQGAAPAPNDQLGREFAAYRAAAAQVGRLQGQGATLAAVTVAGTRADPVATRMSAALTADEARAQSRFATAAQDATSALSGLSVALPVLVALVGALALIGLRARLAEYR